MSVEVSDIALPENTILHNKYRVEEVHYLGQTGIVYFGVDLDDRAEVVIKEFMPYKIANRDMNGKDVICKSRGCQKQFVKAREAFDQECAYVYKLRKLKKPYEACVLKYRDVFEENQTVYFVTEKIKGRSLQDYLENGIDFSVRDTMNMLVDIVDQVHKKGIIHCDIKPSNVIIQDDGKIVLIDFGSACYKKKKGDEMMFASRGYSAPELYHGGKIDEKTDIYSIGAILYYMLTDCQIPAPDDYDESEEIPSIAELIDIPKPLEDVIMKSLQRDRDKRLGSLSIMRKVLNQ
ncbi:MAG: serine/threonine protein kinase [Lachnospiraceae bacterium]|nr:serine/threonine protein kinase [Lachnospiraceae bacterium]